jgi:hypothetical protein
VGYYFDVITHGYGSMPDHAPQIPARDRWQIAGYIRALRLSQSVRLSELPEPARQAALKQLEQASANP